MQSDSFNFEKRLIFVYLLIVTLLSFSGYAYYKLMESNLISVFQEEYTSKVKSTAKYINHETDNIRKVLESNKEIVRGSNKEDLNLEAIYNAMGGRVCNVLLSDSNGDIITQWPDELTETGDPTIKVRLKSPKITNLYYLGATVNLKFLKTGISDHMQFTNDSIGIVYNVESDKLSVEAFNNDNKTLNKFVQGEDFIKTIKGNILSSLKVKISGKDYQITYLKFKIGSSSGMVISAVPYSKLSYPLVNGIYFWTFLLMVFQLFGIILISFIVSKIKELNTKEKDALIAVNNSIRIIGSSLELQQVLEKILYEVDGLFKPSKSTIYQLNDDDYLTLITYQGFNYTQKPLAKLKNGKFFSGQACLENRVISTNDKGSAEILSMEPYHNIKSVMSTPLSFKGVNVGALTIFYEKKKYFTKEEVNNLFLFANHAAIAIENARLYTKSVYLQDKIRDMAVIEERNRIARELHDSLSQSLFSMAFLSEAALNQCEEGSKLQGIIGQLKKITQNAQIDMRGLVFELHPQTILEKGLKIAINNLIQRFSNANPEVEINFSILTNTKINPTIQLNLYRIIQEALTNISKHAQATKIQIRVSVKNYRLFLTIRDNGIGFDPEKLNKGGLIYMKERIYSLNGKLKMFSKLGTLICAMVPLDGECR